MIKINACQFTLKIIAAYALITSASSIFAQDIIKIFDIVELFGGGAIAGANYKNGIELAGDAANGAVAHIGLTVNGPLPAIRAFRAKFEKEYKYISEHNGMKGSSRIYEPTAGSEKVGKLDRKAVANAMHTLKVKSVDQPRVLTDLAFDSKGKQDRGSFLSEVKNGKQEVVATLSLLGAAN